MGWKNKNKFFYNGIHALEKYWKSAYLVKVTL